MNSESTESKRCQLTDQADSKHSLVYVPYSGVYLKEWIDKLFIESIKKVRFTSWLTKQTYLVYGPYTGPWEKNG